MTYQGIADIHVELDGCTLHVNVSSVSGGPGLPPATDYDLVAVDLTDPDAFSDQFGEVVLTAEDCKQWWEDRPDRLLQEIHWHQERHDEPWDVY